MSTSRRPSRARRIAFSIHKWAGLITGTLFFITAATGFVLIFTEDGNLMQRPSVVPGDTYADLAPALAEAAAAHPGYALTSVRLPVQPDLAWIAFFRHPQTNQRVVADFDPYAGKLLGYRDYDSVIFRVLLDLHYTYLAGAAGKVASTLVAVALVALSITGFWIYRHAIRDLFRWRVRRETSNRAALVWLHKWTGLWALGLALIWGVTGFIFMLSILPAAFGTPKRKLAAADPAALRALPNTSAMFAQVRQTFPEGEVINFFPMARGASSPGPSFRVLFRENWPWEKFGEVRFAPSGELTKAVRPEEASSGTKFDNAVAALHFGFLGHRITMIIYALGGLVMIFLPVSGYAMWWLKRRRTAVAQAAALFPARTIPETASAGSAARATR